MAGSDGIPCFQVRSKAIVALTDFRLEMVIGASLINQPER